MSILPFPDDKLKISYALNSADVSWMELATLSCMSILLFVIENTSIAIHVIKLSRSRLPLPLAAPTIPDWLLVYFERLYPCLKGCCTCSSLHVFVHDMMWTPVWSFPKSIMHLQYSYLRPLCDSVATYRFSRCRVKTETQDGNKKREVSKGNGCWWGGNPERAVSLSRYISAYDTFFLWCYTTELLFIFPSSKPTASASSSFHPSWRAKFIKGTS